MKRANSMANNIFETITEKFNEDDGLVYDNKNKKKY